MEGGVGESILGEAMPEEVIQKQEMLGGELDGEGMV
jgi:hypothetical protein